MRSCLFLGAVAAFFFVLPTASTAQDVLGVTRPARGVSRPAGGVEQDPPSLPAASLNSGGITVPRDSKLTAGDQVALQIVEDRDPALLTVVTDTGEIEVNGLGRVYVAGKTTTEAEGVIASYLKQHYYHQATVKLGIVRKAVGTVRAYKVVVSGKVGRPGPQYFNDAGQLKLTEAVIVAGTTLYSNLSKVRLTRGGRSSDHDVELIMKKGRTDLDIELRDGDVIFVPVRGGFTFSN